MSTYTFIYGMYQRLKGLARGDKQYYWYHTAATEQWLSDNELHQIQLTRLNRLVRRSIENSSFYRERLGSLVKPERGLTSLADLSRLPLLTREDIQEHADEILIPVDDTVYADSSGGSTGKPVNFYHDKHYRHFANGLHRLFLSWLELSDGDRTAVFWGADRDFGEMSWRDKLRSKLDRVMALNSFNVDDDTMKAFLEKLQHFSPTYIYGYASSLELAAQHILRHEIKIRPKAVRSSAEMLYENQRELIEKAFDCKVYNFYGSREVNNLAAECPAGEGLHVMASGRIVEVVDETGRPLPPGEIGYLAVTDLTNLSFPFIRYIIGDMGSLRSARCSCGRNYPLLENIAGRASDIITIGGKYIHGEYFTHLFYGMPAVRQFQVVQEEPDRIVIKIVGSNDAVDSDDITKKIHQRVGQPITVDIVFVKEIPTLKSGKYRFTVNKTVAGRS